MRVLATAATDRGTMLKSSHPDATGLSVSTDHYSSQFSNFNPGTFSKSRRLAVSNRALFAMAMHAVFKSMVAILTPALRKSLKSLTAFESSNAIENPEKR